MKGEFEWIEKIRGILGKPSADVLVGIGDDAAVVRNPGSDLVLTTDSVVESIHFDLSFFEPEEVGHKALAVNLSDLAAMGAEPLYALVSLGVPTRRTDFLEGFYEGLAALAKETGIAIVGGNLSRTPDSIFADVVAIGRPTEASLLRSGAAEGDWVGVIGALGEARAGLMLLQKHGRAQAIKRWPELCRAQLRPRALLEAGRTLAREGLATSAIDVSDGLSSELYHLSEQSGVRFEIQASSLLPSPELEEGARELGVESRQLMLSGGEDYALLFTCPPEKKDRIAQVVGSPCVFIGRVKPGPSEVWWSDGDNRTLLPKSGHDHFRSA